MTTFVGFLFVFHSYLLMSVRQTGEVSSPRDGCRTCAIFRAE